MKQKPFTYTDAVRAINADDVRTDIEDACEHLALSTMAMMETFASIAKQLHTIDVQGLNHGSPLKPQWNPLSRVSHFLHRTRPRQLISGPQDFRDLLWQFRSNAGFISGRLKSESYDPARFRIVTSCIFSFLYRGPSIGSAQLVR
jgi:hypothetical protein